MKKSELHKLVQEALAENEKPGLWANIRAKRARGEKPAHKNSNAHKDAVKAGKKINAANETDLPEAVEDSSAGTEAYYEIRSLIQKHARNLSDDDAYTMHELLKDFFNRYI